MEKTRISHYTITRRLGRGGMGEAYEALDLDLGRMVALKFVAPQLATDAEAITRLEREARSAAVLQHPHIATLYAFERDAGQSFIAMERMTGGSVRERLAGGRLPIGQALAIARDTAGALAHAHRRGIVHRDVKPENLMFSDGGIVKLMDLGLARATEASRLTTTGSALGTAAYMPPESRRGGAGPPGDIFALGVTLHEMLAGELPFTGDTPLALLDASANEPPRPLRGARPDAPPAVEALIQRMLAKDPAARPDATAVARELALMTGAPIPFGVDEVAPATVVAGAAAVEAAAPASGLRLPRWAVWLLAMMPIAALTALLAVLVPGMFYESRNDRHTTAVALSDRGYQQLQADSLPEARASLEAALAAEPRYAPAMLNLGLALLRSGDARAAMPAFDRALELDPGLASALGLRAEARAQLNDARGARADWEAYLGMAHDQAEQADIEARLRALGALSN
jgi:serine/threonine-protein kinase